jgi:arylsulfatase A-like enzyme
MPIPPGRERQVKNFRIYTLQDKSIENTTLFLLENIPVDLFATYFRLIDTTSHFTSIFIDEDLRDVWIQENEDLGAPSPETEKKLYLNMATIVEPVYSYLDQVVGRIIEKSPENATFVLVSDHGFNFSPKGYSHYDTPSIAHGIFAIKGPGIKPGIRLDQVNIYDITPTLLYLFGLPVGEDMDGRVIGEVFHDKFKKSRKIKFIPTYGAPSKSEEGKKPRELDKEVLEDLKSLGYIK